MVHTLEGLDVEVAEGVVALLVVYIQQRGNLRKTVGHMLQQTAGALLIAGLVVVKLYQHHPLAGGGVAEHDVAEQTVLGAKVEEGHAGGVGVVADGIAYLVVKRVHQPALLDGEYLVESARDVETDGVGLFHGRTGGHFLAGEPAAVAAAELQLVAVETGVYGTQYVIKRGKLHLADARQLVENLALLHLQLGVVGQILPLATAADTEMGAHGLGTPLAFLYKTYHLRLAVVVLLLAHL